MCAGREFGQESLAKRNVEDGSVGESVEGRTGFQTSKVSAVTLERESLSGHIIPDLFENI